MCGLVGVASNFTNGFSMDEVNSFQDMLVIDSLRGVDSTGAFMVDKSGSVRIAKSAQHGLDFVMTPEFKKLRGDIMFDALFAVGHNRAATKGTINDKNAHPFWVDNKIVLMQNGTVRGDHTKIANGAKSVEVDSEAVAHLISETADIEEALQKLNSGFALVWYNVETETLHLIRNDERPLWYAKGEHNGMIWASEEATLLYVINKYRSKIQAPKILPAGELMSLKLKDDHYEIIHKPINHNYIAPPYVSPVYNNDYEVAYGGLPFSHGVHRSSDDTHNNRLWMRQRSAVAESVAFKKNDVHVDFTTWSINHLEGFHLSNDDVEKTLTAAKESAIDKKLYVELMDYIPANAHNDCTVYHVYGSLLLPDDSLSSVLIHWIVFDKTPDDMKAYFDQMYYRVAYHDFNVVRIRRYQKDFSIIKVFGYNVETVITELEDTTNEVQTAH